MRFVRFVVVIPLLEMKTTSYCSVKVPGAEIVGASSKV